MVEDRLSAISEVYITAVHYAAYCSVADNTHCNIEHNSASATLSLCLIGYTRQYTATLSLHNSASVTLSLCLVGCLLEWLCSTLCCSTLSVVERRRVTMRACRLHWLTHWLTHWLVDSLAYWLSHWLTGSLAMQVTVDNSMDKLEADVAAGHMRTVVAEAKQRVAELEAGVLRERLGHAQGKVVHHQFTVRNMAEVQTLQQTSDASAAKVAELQKSLEASKAAVQQRIQTECSKPEAEMQEELRDRAVRLGPHHEIGLESIPLANGAGKLCGAPYIVIGKPGFIN